jgi:hypothetical protein
VGGTPAFDIHLDYSPWTAAVGRTLAMKNNVRSSKNVGLGERVNCETVDLLCRAPFGFTRQISISSGGKPRTK